ncbi:hypothetical protein LSTR_LSTR007399 [Laodelphax striatellus]|uniref:Generative cell specific-1/HAP2 domain-containing protein n=1 Tax=Laodelphax striatellus TaxID=195883 RepID=A0A482XNM7_LAOST|nr:hypothetical protein LSTR_LSTR007399 [Laodelphax striatellus]
MIKYPSLFILITSSSLLFQLIQSLTNEEVKSSRRDVQGRIEIRAIMVNCHPEVISKTPRKNCNDEEGSDVVEFRGFGKDEITMHSIVKDCKRKLVITMRLKNDKKTVTEEQFVVVDHVYDPVFKKRSRLLNPFVFKIKQNQVLQLYGLQFQNIVNAEVTEEVINKNQDNFTGCDVTSSHPTCGFSLSQNREVIPYSEGFCCSCDAYVNSQRQPLAGFTTSRSLHRIGPSPIHVKTHNLPRHNRDTFDYHNSDTKLISNQKIVDVSKEMQLIGTENGKTSYESNSPVSNDDTSIPFQESEDDLQQVYGSHMNSDVNYPKRTENKYDLISSEGEVQNNKNSETQNSFIYPFDKSIAKERRSIEGVFSNNNKDATENTCNTYEKSFDQEMENVHDNYDFFNQNQVVGLSEGEVNLESDMNPNLPSYLVLNTDSLENRKMFSKRLVSQNLQSTAKINKEYPSKFIEENMVSIADEEDIKPLSNNEKLVEKDKKPLGPNSILNSHDELKPVIVSKLDGKISNPFRNTDINNVNVVPILEHAHPMEPAIGFKKEDKKKLLSMNPWNIHMTDCPETKNRRSSTPRNSYLQYLKFREDWGGGDVERLKDVSTSNRQTVKLEDIKTSEESNLDKVRQRKRNTSGSADTKNGESTGEIEKRRKRLNVKRQASPNGNQIRGGQSCIDRSTPPGVDPITYHESAHCLRYSDLWYTVYHLRRPFVEHSLRLKLYEKYDYHDKNTHWDEITAGRQTILGTFNSVVQDEKPTFSFSYMPSSEQEMGPFQLDTEKSTLLVPQPVSEQLQDKYPQAGAGPSEYLLLKSDQISLDGDECDKAGVGFSAFAKQSDRCSHVRGSCLRNQPLHLWKHDRDALENGKEGKYFLKNFACISTNPFIVNRSNSDEFLAIEYHNPYSATIEIEVKSDFNGVIRPGIGAQIPEVYVDATCDSNTKIVVTVANMGLASARFFPRLANCPGGLPEVWLTSRSPAVMIAPQHQHRFHLSLFGVLPIGRFHCSIDVLNDNHDIVATRRIRIQRYDRCFCLFHCLCACIASSKGLSCDQMSIEHYHAAGFLGSLPVPIVVYETSTLEKNFNLGIYLLIAFLIIPLLLGLLKALSCLCCCTWLSSAGISAIIDTGKGKGKPPQSKEEDGESGQPPEESQEPNLCITFLLNIFIFFFVVYLAIAKLLNILCSILCCCALFNGAEESEKRKGSTTESPDDDDDERHVSFDEGGEGVNKFNVGDDGDKNEGEEDDDDEDEDDGDDEPERLKIVGGDDLDDDDESQTDLLEYFNKPDALEGDQVKKIMKKFKQYYKSNPPDRKDRTGEEEENDDEVEDGLSEYETKVAESFIDLLLESEEVYRHFSEPVGDIIMPEGFEYCIRGFLVKSDTGYFFIPPSPLLQYWTHDKQLMEPPQPLAFADFEKAYDSAVDVLISYDLDLMPNGPAVNVYHL